jgi:P22_AR N-terminal domain
MAEDTRGSGQQPQALEPIEQEEVPFKGETIIAVRLADGHICVVLRWVCETLRLDPQGQVQRIQRTSATASELVRVRVQTKGGRQSMPAITLRGFSPWVLGINPNEVKSDNPAEDERIRALIVAYQEEAKDVLYEYFVNKRRLALPAPHTTVVPAEPIKPQEVEPGATDAELTTYYENLALWARWKADQHAQQLRGQMEEWRGSVEARLEGDKAMLDLIPDIVDRLGPETLTPQHHRQVQTLAKQLHQVSSKPYPTIYDDLKTAFEKPRIEDLLEDDWLQIENWFRVQIERAKGKPRR